MTKLENLSKNHNFLNISLIDILKLIDPSKKCKYVELLYKLGPKSTYWRDRESVFEISHILKKDYCISEDLISNMKEEELQMIFFLVERFFTSFDIKMLNKLHDLSSNNLIENLDISNINSFQDISNLVTLAELKKNNKDLEKKTIVLFRDENWLVLRPLSHESSLKYGAQTKWCTVSEKEPHYFFRYIKRGMLIYIINMKTGNKTAFFHTTDSESEKETSFWNVSDVRIDSIQTDLSTDILELIKKEIKTNKSNWYYIEDEEKLKIDLEYMNHGSGRLVAIEDALVQAAEDYNRMIVDIPIPNIETIANMRG